MMAAHERHNAEVRKTVGPPAARVACRPGVGDDLSASECPYPTFPSLGSTGGATGQSDWWADTPREWRPTPSIRIHEVPEKTVACEGYDFMDFRLNWRISRR